MLSTVLQKSQDKIEHNRQQHRYHHMEKDQQNKMGFRGSNSKL